MNNHDMRITLRVWRQKSASEPGKLESYLAEGLSPDMSFLEMLDKVNEDLVARGVEPIAFDHDCREGVCGTCSLMINGLPHGGERGTTSCQLHMRSFRDGASITVEPWRAKAFPVVRDLVVDRSAFDRVIEAGGFISVNTGAAPDARSILVPKKDSEAAFDAAACIGCGACVAACPNGSAMLFVAAKVSHLAHLPQGQPERWDRVRAMVERMDTEGFGACSNHFECEASCPKEISAQVIAELNKDFIKASVLDV